ncbi:hypothetical protein AGMMS49957_13320 [Synergistales bacterium]|nr:hypothetical protein AGMMS49957_13320 [Synergistales bacterium]
MNIANIVIGIIAVSLVVFSVWHNIRKKGGCSGCCACCAKAKSSRNAASVQENRVVRDDD